MTSDQFKKIVGEYSLLIEEYAAASEQLDDCRLAVMRRTCELVRDPDYLGLTNERSRSAFIDEYLDYDGLPRRLMKAQRAVEILKYKLHGVRSVLDMWSKAEGVAHQEASYDEAARSTTTGS